MKYSFTHLIIALVVGIASLSGYGVWYAAIVAKSTDVAELQSQIATQTETADRVSAAHSALAEIAGDEAIVRDYFVPESGIVAFFDDLESRGLSQGATVDVVSVSTSGSPAHPTLILSLTARGSFDAVMRTIGAIEYAPYNLSISALALAQDNKNNWRADFKLLVGSVSTSTKMNTL